MTSESRRIAREKKTIRAMLAIFCRAHHPRGEGLCPECAALLAYALERLGKCPFGAEKPTCAHCPVHCYRPDRREAARRVMRYAGPRMVWRHPLLAFLHLLDSRSKAPRARKP